MNVYQKGHFLIFYLCFSIASISEPLSTPTALPFPKGASDAERDMVAEISKIQVYPDSIDPNQFYYIPPFHTRQYTHGAANMLLDSVQIGFYVDAKKALLQKETYSREKILKLEQESVRAQEAVFSAQLNLREAIQLGNQDFIASSQSFLSFVQGNHQRLVQELERARQIVEDGGTIVSEGLRREFNRQAISHIAFGGVNVFFFDDTLTELERAVREGMAQLGNTYGGYLVTNIYAGFTEAQIEALRAYKSRFYPNIKITLMPAKNLKFFPLFEVANKDEKIKHSETIKRSFLKDIRGSGDYLGSTVVLDVSVTGGMALASHLGPFILPLGIEADLPFNAQATDIDLDCDFSTEFSMPGRNSIRPGVSMFDTADRLLLLNEFDNSMCRITVREGNAASIAYWLEKTINQAMVDAGAVKTMLTITERMDYAKIAEQAPNRPYVQPRFYRLSNPTEYFGWMPLAHRPGMYGMIPEYHYAVDEPQVTSFSRLRIKKHIYIRGEEQMNKHLPTNLCLVFNSELKVYDRCTEGESINSQSMNHSAKDALSSFPCKSSDNPFDCGRKRDDVLANSPERPRRFSNDDLVVSGI